MERETKLFKKFYRFATWAVFNEHGKQHGGTYISVKDAYASLAVWSKVTRGCYVAMASKTIEKLLTLRVPIDYNNEMYGLTFDANCNIQQLLAMRTDDVPYLLPDKVNNKVLKSLSDKAAHRHRGQHGGLVDRDSKYVPNEYDETAQYPNWGVVKYAESASFNKGSSTLKKPKLNKDRAGSSTLDMSLLANGVPNDLELEMYIRQRKNDMTLVELYKDIKSKWRNRGHSNKKIKTALRKQY